MHYKCCNEWLNLIFVSNSENLRNNGKYWIIGILSEILCTDSSGSIDWALSLSLGSKPASLSLSLLSLGSKTIEPEPKAPKNPSSRAWSLSLWTSLLKIVSFNQICRNTFRDFNTSKGILIQKLKKNLDWIPKSYNWITESECQKPLNNVLKYWYIFRFAIFSQRIFYKNLILSE